MSIQQDITTRIMAEGNWLEKQMAQASRSFKARYS